MLHNKSYISLVPIRSQCKMAYPGVGIKASIPAYHRFRNGKEILVMLEKRRYENEVGLPLSSKVRVDVANPLAGIGIRFCVLRK